MGKKAECFVIGYVQRNLGIQRPTSFGMGMVKATTFSVASSSSLVEKCLRSRIQKLDYRKVFELFIFNRFDICQLGSALPLYSQILAESLWVCDKDRPRTTKGGRSRIAHCLLQQK